MTTQLIRGLLIFEHSETVQEWRVNVFLFFIVRTVGAVVSFSSLKETEHDEPTWTHNERRAENQKKSSYIQWIQEKKNSLPILMKHENDHSNWYELLTDSQWRGTTCFVLHSFRVDSTQQVISPTLYWRWFWCFPMLYTFLAVIRP